jgi:hypothetical protein
MIRKKITRTKGDYMTAILFLLLTVSAWAQDFQYQLEGSFTSPDEVIVNYNIHWNETSSEIQGIYRDNFYAREGPQTVTGSVSSEGRRFRVIFPEEFNGVRSLTFVTPQVGDGNTNIAMTVTTRNAVEATVGTLNSFALMTPRAPGPADNEDTNPCTVGFGVLTGYCGFYSGMVNEILDNNFRCDLLSGGEPRLELAADTYLRLHLRNRPAHNIGAFLPSPITTSVNVSSRQCSPIPGTSFTPNNCKTLNLTGYFFDQASNILFSGTYTITDDINADTCSYSLSLRRERTF